MRLEVAGVDEDGWEEWLPVQVRRRCGVRVGGVWVLLMAASWFM